MTIRPAEPDDFAAVSRLVAQHGLPLAGLREHLGATLVATIDDGVCGSAALELYEDGALLRSVAVAQGAQHQGIGRALVDAVLTLAESRAVPALYLLTTTAEQYFARFGFERTVRAAVPPGVQSSIEFTSACPASATVMRRTLS